MAKVGCLRHQHHLQKTETLTHLKARSPFAFKQPEVFAVIIVATECMCPLMCSRRWVGLVSETFVWAYQYLLSRSMYEYCSRGTVWSLWFCSLSISV